MAYQPNIPLATDLISNSQGDIQGNFQAIDSGTTGAGTGFARNHISMTTAGTGGEHYRIDFPDAPLTPAPAATESSIYPELIGGKQDLKFKNATNTIQITNSLLTAASGQGMLPGGLQIRCGSASATGSGAANNFNPVFPNACLSVIAIGTDSANYDVTMKITAKSAASFTLRSQKISGGGGGGAENCYYIAIGY